MKKTAAVHSLTDQLKGALEDIQAGSVRSMPAARPLPVARALSAGEVRAARDSLNMSQSEFAELLQVATKTVQAWEAGRRSPGPGQARWIDMFTGPEWCDRLRKPAPHLRAAHRSAAVDATARAGEGEQAGPRRRLGGRPRSARPSGKPAGSERVASAGRARPAGITERMRKSEDANDRDTDK